VIAILHAAGAPERLLAAWSIVAPGNRAAHAVLYRAKEAGKDRFAVSAASIGSSGYER